MSGRPWYKRCGADFIEGTMGLTLEEKGAYSLCLDLIYSHGGPIADDPRWIAGICNVSLRKWTALRQRLVSAGKIFVSEGKISNARADKELIISKLSSEKLSESGAKGGRNAAENKAAVNNNNDLGQAGLKHLDKIREDNKKDTLRDASASTEAEVFRFGKEVLGRSAGGVIVKLKAHCDGDLVEMRAILRDAGTKETPMEWVQAVLRGPDKLERDLWRGVDYKPLTPAQIEYGKLHGLR